ncbi:MAG: Maf family protein [Spirochaetia bacterium]|jgi:septum formation protein|nr:Maf family protein [Spirochaetia bacterium]
MVILGSASPRRRELLGIIYPLFDISAPNINEEIRGGESPRSFAERMSREKMEAVLQPYSGKTESFLAVTADTVVAIDDETIGKPKDFDDALRILELLSGNTHEVITGLTIFIRRSGEGDMMITSHEITRVTFKELGDAEIRRYLSITEYMDKAGAYAAQENGSLIIKEITGSVSNVLGFPLRLFFRMIPLDAL